MAEEYILTLVKERPLEPNPAFHLTSTPDNVRFVTIDSQGRTQVTGDATTPERYNHNVGVFGWPVHFIFSKEGYETLEFELTKDDVLGSEWNLHINLEPKAEYPKTISREAVYFNVINAEQEKQAKEFLGIDPPGDDLDTWLSKRDLAGLEQWQDYWTKTFIPIGLGDWVGFINTKFEAYKFKLEEEAPPGETWWQIMLKDAVGLDLSLLDRIKALLGATMFLDSVNAILSLLSGKDIDGNPKEFSPTEDSLSLAVDALMFVPILKIPGLVGKLLGKFGTKGIFRITEKVILKKATPEVIEAIIKTDNYTHILRAIREAPYEWSKLLPKLSTEAKNLIMAGLKKQSDATAYILAKEALRDAALKEGGVTGIIAFITKGRNILWGLTGMVGALSMAYGISFGTSWFVKEGLVEQFTIPLSDRMREYRKNPTPELLELILKQIENIERVLPLGEKLIKAVSWLWPLTKDEWDEYIDGVRFELQNIKDELAGIEPPKPKGTLIIRPDPTDAKVSVEGEIPSTGVFDSELEIGIYTYTVSKFGFVSRSDSIEITEDDIKEINVILEEEIAPPVPPEEQKGNLIISVTPKDAKIEVSGEEEITAPGTYELYQGFYTLKVSKEGFETQITTSYIRAQEDTRASFVLKEIITPPEIAIIRVESDPIGATIFIDGETTFNITNTSLQVDPGMHTLTIKKKEFIDKPIDFEIKAGESLSFNLTMEEIPKPPVPLQATITITSIPTDADIYIDGEYTFTKTPYTVLLDAGDYYFRVQKEGYYPTEIIAEVEEGETAEVPITLNSIPVTDIPADPYIPYQPTYPTGYETLYPAVQAPIYYTEPEPLAEKELLVNLETTDAKPWKGRIYSIAFQDLSVPGSNPTVLIGDNEEELLFQFMNIFNQINPARLLGFKLAFDHRFIFNKLMLYRMQSKKWADIELKDVKQLMDQVKEEFVYFPDKTGKLDDYGKELLGKGKYGTQANMLTQYLAKNFDYVRAFQERQLEVTNGLYQLHRFSTSETASAPIPPIPPITSNPETPLNPQSVNSTGQKQCANCLAFNPLDATECSVCGSTQFK